jgi:iduronate 2-sulfatase
MTWNRRRFLATGTAAACGLALPRLLAQAATNQWNVLFLPVDDLRPLLGCYGDTAVKSPHIDRLAARSLTFDRAYCNYPVCGPSRSSFLTGLYPDQSRIYGFENADSKVGRVTCLPQHFKNHGYRTARLGKVFNNPNDFPAAWDEKPFKPTEPGYTWKSSAYQLKENRDLCEGGPGKSRGFGAATEMADAPDEAYEDGWIARQAVDFLERHKAQRFFLAAGFNRPHLPFAAPKKYWDLYDPATLPPPAHPEAPEGIEPFMTTPWAELRAYSDMPKDDKLTPEQTLRLRHGYYASVSFADAQIGLVLNALDRFGLASNTMVVLWGDHSFHLGENNIWAKHVNWELTNRSPLIVHTPGMKAAGQRTRALVEFVDLYPTLAAACGLPVPETCAGRPATDLLDNASAPFREAALSQYQRGTLMSYSIRTDRWRYSEWRQGGVDGPAAGRELYDLEADPAGCKNLAKSAPPDVLSALAVQLQGYLDAIPPAPVPAPLTRPPAPQ